MTVHNHVQPQTRIPEIKLDGLIFPKSLTNGTPFELPPARSVQWQNEIVGVGLHVPGPGAWHQRQRAASSRNTKFEQRFLGAWAELRWGIVHFQKDKPSLCQSTLCHCYGRRMFPDLTVVLTIRELLGELW